MDELIQKTTISDLARELNLTPSTISRALNNHPAISIQTKEAVHKLALQRHYQPNRIAASLRSGKSRILGVLIPSAEINFFGAVIHGIENVARMHDYNVLICQSNEEETNESRGVNTFVRSRVAGVLASLSKETRHLQHFVELKRKGIPLVLFDRAIDELNVPSVVIDDYKGAFMATRHLAEQGCRRIGHIAGQQHVAIFHARLQGYRDALASLGLEQDPSLIVYGMVTIASGSQCMNELLSLPEPPDGVFAVEDFTALGAIQAIKESGKSIPADVAVIGFANAEFGRYITPALSTVDQQSIIMGEEAAKMFFMLSEGDNFYNKSPQKKILEPLIIGRASSIKKE